jgi:hypothetical protein
VAREVLTHQPNMRMLAWLLGAYAVMGSILVLTALIVGGPLVARLDRVTTSASDTMTAAAAAARAASDAFDGFDTSVEQARTSAEDAAGLSRETATTLDGLAATMSLELFGAQPLLPLAGQFERSADQMRQLGDNLDTIGQALDANRTDIAAVGVQMGILASELEELEGRIAAERGTGGLPLSWLYYGFLVWQLLPIAAAAIGSAWLFRHTRVVVVAGEPATGA